MTRLLRAACVVVLGFTAGIGLAWAEQAKSPAHKPSVKKDMLMWSAGDLKWVSDPGAAGLQNAVLWGDPAKGPHGAFNKFPAGFAVPLHTHKYDLRAAVVSGTMVETPEGGPAKELGPGSYFFIPGGLKHSTACKAGSECIVFRESLGAWDVTPVQAPAGKK
jgi:hypothetical protein